MNKEYFIKQTYIPLQHLHQNVLKDKNPANGVQFGVHLRDTEKKTLKNLSSLKTNKANSDKTKINQVQKKIILDKSLLTIPT